MTKKVAIIGAGTAGLAAASFLSKLDFDCDLYEEVEQPQAIGAGILLQPQGLYVLDKLGILPEVLKTGSKIDSLFGMNQNKRIIMDFKYTDLQSGLYGLGVHRGQLFNALYRLAQRTVVNFYLGHKVIKISQNNTGAQITTDKGIVESYDLIVIANGTWSTLLSDLNIDYLHKPYPWGALWKIFDNPDKFSQRMLNQKYIKSHTMVGMLPSGVSPQTNQACVSFFWSMQTNKLAAWKNQNIDLWKDEVIKLWPELKSFVQNIVCHEDLKFVRYADTIMKKWHDNKVVVIGDAAHAMSPQLGQGANMALVDALELYHCLQQSNQIEPALATYSKSRYKHLRFYQNASRLLTPFFQSNSKSAALFRDTFFPPMRFIPIAKKHALTTLFGVKSSILHNKATIDLQLLSNDLKKHNKNT